jgi:DNA-binding MarR family transcriptional regulator
MLTLDIRHIHYTAALHALATDACRHAERAGDGQADDLYRVARLINDIGIYIRNTGLEDILNRPLPLPASVAPIAEDDDNATNRVLTLLADHPEGLTAKQIATELDHDPSTIRKAITQLIADGKVTGLPTSTGQAQQYILIPADATGFIASTAPAGDQTPSTVKLNIPNHPALTGRDGAPDRIILALLAAGPIGLTSSQLTDAIKYSYSVTMSSVSRLTKAGHITRSHTKPTRYYLTNTQTQSQAAD